MKHLIVLVTCRAKGNLNGFLTLFFEVFPLRNAAGICGPGQKLDLLA